MTDNHHFDKNLKRMLESAFEPPRPAFQEQLVQDVLAEVKQERAMEKQGRVSAVMNILREIRASLRRVQVRWAAGIAVVLLVAVGIWLGTGAVGGKLGQVSCLYGLVVVQEDGTSETVSQAMDLKSGQRVKTQVGSQAQIVLPDRSRLIPEPRTSLQIARTRQGPRIKLEQGTVSVEAAKQARGQSITIEAARARVKVLGTRLDVRLVEKSTGSHQTRVRVVSGRVEMESGGRNVLLLPGTEGVADEGQPPVRSSVVFEVNELLGLVNQTRVLAAQSGRTYGLPAIIDLTTETLWLVVPGQRLQATGPSTFSVKLKYPAFRARAYTLEGAELPSEGKGNVLRLEASGVSGPPAPEYVILKVPGVGGLVRAGAEGLVECSFRGTDRDLPALIQLHLPESARIEQAAPSLVGTSRERNRLIVTLAASIDLPQVCE